MIKAVVFDMFETLITHYETPLYFSMQMAEDAGLDPISFRDLWRETDTQRTVGDMTYEECVEGILRSLGKYSPELFELILRKRVATKTDLFNHLHPEIIPMLEALRGRGIKIGLISNCFSEEAAVIKASLLWEYFDAPCLSYDEHLRKPDPAIFRRCVEKLGLQPDECLYVGDGGSMELEAAEAFGMQTAQATWYLRPEIPRQSRPNPEFKQLGKPMDILKLL